MEIMDNIRYFYLHDGNRHVTVGRVYNPDENSVVFTYAVSNPRDRFNRKLGREIVEKRLAKHKENVFYIDLLEGEKPMKVIIEQMSFLENFPPCVRKVANSWLRNKEEW